MESNEYSYQRFTGPQIRDKAINTIIGILKGILSDGKINSEERNEIKEWLSDYANISQTPPFDEIAPKLNELIQSESPSPDEIEDMTWALENCRLSSPYYDEITQRIQELHGLLHGIICDGKIEIAELKSLHSWIVQNEDLKGTYPYDEIESMTIAALADGQIDDQEHAELMTFFNDFITYSFSKRIDNEIKRVSKGAQDDNRILKGICAINPDITFRGKTFVLTGESERATRTEISEIIINKEGHVSSGIIKADYLIIGNEGNRAWAFSCYGRKVEKAMQARREGSRIVLVNEVDFWDAI